MQKNLHVDLVGSCIDLADNLEFTGTLNYLYFCADCGWLSEKCVQQKYEARLRDFSGSCSKQNTNAPSFM